MAFWNSVSNRDPKRNFRFKIELIWPLNDTRALESRLRLELGQRLRFGWGAIKN